MRAASRTSKSSIVTIACALCIGAAREVYLKAALDAIAQSVDILVVNDNSGLGRNDNIATLEASAFAARSALHIRAEPFIDFADMRNRAFAQLRALSTAPDWVLFMDADEVHGAQLRYVARELLPRLTAEIGNVDAYTYHFFGTFHWITDVARRFVFYRYRPDLRWENAVHEKIVGLTGRALVLPYVYHHYGNVVAPAELARKHQRYFGLGNPVPAPPPERATTEMYLAKARAVRPYRREHPRAVRATIARLESEYAAELAAIDTGFRAARTPAVELAAGARGALEMLRVELRRVEHPAAYRAPTRGR